MTPLQLGTVAEFATFRELLRESDYTEDSICKRLGLRQADEIVLIVVEPGFKSASGTCDVLNLLIKLFLVMLICRDSRWCLL